MKFFIFFQIVFILVFSACSNFTHSIKTDEFYDEDCIVEPDEDIVENPLIFDVEVEKNEKNVLSCRLTFKTKEKIKAVVRYFSKDHKGYEIVDETQKDEHYFFLWGMRAETKYIIEIYDEQNLDEPIETTEYLSGFLPNTIPYTFLAVNEKEKVSDGFVLFVPVARKEEEAEPIAVMVDTEGEIVWYFQHFLAGFSIFGDVQFIEKSKSILISIKKGLNMADIPAEEAIEIDIEGNILWRSKESANVYYDEKSWHHAYKLLEDNTILFLMLDVRGSVVGDKIVNVDRDYNELWTWYLLDHIEEPSCDPSEWCDWTHSNSVLMYKERNSAYINSRHLSTYFKIDIHSNNVVWKLGKDGDFLLQTEVEFPWFEFAHDPEISFNEKTAVIFYDNGSLARGFSRIIEYVIDEENMTAEVSFIFDGSEIDRMWFTEFWGDADSLPNGNIFVTAGAYNAQEDSRLFEVTRDGEIVWELFMEKHSEGETALYNSQKFVPPLKKLN